LFFIAAKVETYTARARMDKTPCERFHIPTSISNTSFLSILATPNMEANKDDSDTIIESAERTIAPLVMLILPQQQLLSIVDLN
ncbi:hypothetical protein PFISCL1PPCAC_2694, partial [Pristionchus fissidentatus]